LASIGVAPAASCNEPITAGRAERIEQLRGAVEHALQDGGTVLIPAFSNGRTQELQPIAPLGAGAQPIAAPEPEVLGPPTGTRRVLLVTSAGTCLVRWRLSSRRGLTWCRLVRIIGPSVALVA
jgi:hypothetical protein